MDYFTGYSGQDDPAQKNVTLMRASQYNKLRVASGLEPVDFGTDGYMVWTLDTNLTKYWQDSLANNPELTIQGHKLHAVGGTLDIAQTQGGPALMPATGIVVVADQSFPSSVVLTNSYILGNYQTPGDATETQFQGQIKQYLGDGAVTGSDSDPYSLMLVVTASEYIQGTTGLSGIVTYLALYIGLVLFIACAAILALQQLSEASDTLALTKFLQSLVPRRALQVARSLFRLACTFCSHCLWQLRMQHAQCLLWFLSSSRLATLM